MCSMRLSNRIKIKEWKANMNNKEMDEYVINSLTMAILPMTYGSKLYSHIYQYDEELHSPFKPLEIIKKSCRLNGSSYEGRKEGSRQLIGITHKIPITINSANSMYFFPSASPNHHRCVWISHEHVDSFKKFDSNSTLVSFRNKQSIVLPVSLHIFQNQMQKTALLRTKLMQRSEDNIRKFMNSYRGYSRASEHISNYGDKETFDWKK
jgi:competence protein ComK